MKSDHENNMAVAAGKRYATVFAPMKNRTIASGYKGNYEWWDTDPDIYGDESFIEDDEGIKLHLKTPRKTRDILSFDDDFNYW